MSSWVLLSEPLVFIKSLPRRKDLLFWLVVFPAVLLLLLNFIFSPEEATVSFKVGVVNRDEGMVSKVFIEIMNETKTLTPVILEGDVDVRELLRKREYPLVIVIPRGFSDNITRASQARIEVYHLEGSQESRLALNVLEGYLVWFEGNISNTAARIFVNNMPEPFRSLTAGYIMFIADPVILEPYKVETRGVSAVKTFKVHIVMTVIGVSLLFTGILNGLYTVVEKRYEGYVQTLLSSPTRAYKFMLSEILAILVGSFIAILAVLVVGLTIGAPLHEIPFHKLLISILLLVASVLGLIGLGMVLSVLVKSPQSAGALGNAIAFPVMFLGGLAVPKWMLPSWLQVFPEIIPHTRLVYSTIYYTLGEWSLEEMLVYALPAITLSLTLLLLGALIYRRVLERMYESP